MDIEIFNINGLKTGKVLNLDEKIFNIKSKDHIVYLDIKRYLFSQRQGTHKSKERNEISKSNKKLQRQKGTGNARKGSAKNPIFRGGGRVFGPSPRKYNIKLNKKIKKLSKYSILTNKLINNKLIILEEFFLKKPKTKDALKIIDSLNLKKNKILIILEKTNKILYLSFRNIKNIKVIIVSELNSYDLLNYNYIIFSENSMKTLQTII